MYKGAQHTLDARMACRRCSAVMLFLSFAMCFETASSFRNTAANFDFLIGRSPRCRSLALTAWAPPAWQKGRRVARFTPLAMSEIAEDYPSDTGDDRFSSGVAMRGREMERERASFTATDTPEVAQLKLDLLRIAALTGRIWSREMGSAVPSRVSLLISILRLNLVLTYGIPPEFRGGVHMKPPYEYRRGQLATPQERYRAEDLIWELEARTPIEDSATSEAIRGRWALVYASEDPTRSSPFFWAFRKATETLKVPFRGDRDGVASGSSSVAATIFAITDSIPGKSIGEAVQTITPDVIKSEVEVFAGAGAGSDRRGSDGPASFPSFRSVMTTTSEITGAKGNRMTLRVAKTQVRKSAIGRLLKPLFNLDDVEFKTDRLLTPLREGSTEVSMTTTYLDGLLRVSRNEQGQVFVFAREDDVELR